MKCRLMAVTVILALFLQTCVFAAEPVIQAALRKDPVNQIILINGAVSNGPERQISLVVTDEQGQTVYVAETSSVSGGAFSFTVGTGNFSNGSYTAVMGSEGCQDYKVPFTVPFEGSAVPIQAAVETKTLIMQDEFTADPDFGQMGFAFQNTQVRVGVIPQAQFQVSGLPEGLYFEAEAIAVNQVVLTLKGRAAQPVTQPVLFTVTFLTGVIAGGTANTSSAPLGPFTLLDQGQGGRVQFTSPLSEYRVMMKNWTQIDTGANSFEVTVALRKLQVNGELTCGVHFDYTENSMLAGLKVQAVASQAANSIKFSVAGTALQSVTTDQIIGNLTLKKEAVAGAEADSAPLQIKVIAPSPAPSVPGPPGSGGGGDGGGGTVISPSTPPITDPKPPETDLDPIVPLEKVTFDDLQGHWAKAYVEALASRGIVKGVGENQFAPDQNVTRAEFVAMIVRTLGLKPSETTGSFGDVGEGDWFQGAVETALENGLVTKDANFRPNDLITREEMTKMAVSAWSALNAPPKWISQATFLEDYGQVSDWAKEFVNLGVTVGLVKGNDKNEFLPKENATRAESATIVYRLLDTVESAQ